MVCARYLQRIPGAERALGILRAEGIVFTVRWLRTGVAVEELVDVGIVDAGEDAGRQRGQHV